MILPLFLLILFCSPAQLPEATSLLGKELCAPELSPEERQDFEEKLAKAQSDFQKDPDDPEKIIWVGRRTAYLGRFREAIKIYTAGIQKHPDSAKLYRHRGHRYLTVREIKNAQADFEKAAELIKNVPDEIEPDGLPNAKNIPLSTTNSNIWYHLGLAYYLQGDWEKAKNAYGECMKFSKNDDSIVSTAYWYFLTLRRLGEKEEAGKLLEKIHKKMEIIENSEYHNLLLMFKGETSPEALLTTQGDDVASATTGYGVGAWYLLNGNRDKAISVFKKIVEGKMWPAFGHLAAEAELAKAKASTETLGIKSSLVTEVR